MSEHAHAGPKSKNGEATIEALPGTTLAQKILAALVDNGLIAETDGESIRIDLAAGKVDAARWKLVLENQLERKGGTDEQE